jgi:hypothetical protein
VLDDIQRDASAHGCRWQASRLNEIEELDPNPAEDGKYYLMPGDRSTMLAWELFEQGVEVYCGICKAPLKISRAYVLCSKDQKHFNVIV